MVDLENLRLLVTSANRLGTDKYELTNYKGVNYIDRYEGKKRTEVAKGTYQECYIGLCKYLGG